MTRAVPAERAEPVVPEDQVARAVPADLVVPEDQVARAVPVEARAVPVDLVVPEALEDRVVVDPAVPGALVEVQVDPAGDRVDPAATSNAAVSAGRLLHPMGERCQSELRAEN